MVGQYKITVDAFTTWPRARDIKPISIESPNKEMSPDPFSSDKFLTLEFDEFTFLCLETCTNMYRPN